MDRGAQEAMRNQMGLDLEQAAEGGVLRGRSTAQGEGSGPAADGRGVGGVGETSVRFVVPGQPVGKGRPRAAKRGNHIQLYTPEKTVSYEALVATAAHGAMEGRVPMEGACRVVMDIRLTVPLSWSAKKRQQALDGQLLPTKKPDADNVIKAIFDALNGIVWQDDVQVVQLQASKRYSAVPGVTVVVRSMEAVA